MEMKKETWIFQIHYKSLKCEVAVIRISAHFEPYATVILS